MTLISTSGPRGAGENRPQVNQGQPLGLLRQDQKLPRVKRAKRLCQFQKFSRKFSASTAASGNQNPDGFLFVTRNNRPPSSNKVVKYRLWPFLDKLGIPRCGLHAFRHTQSSLLLESGATPAVEQRQLRHSDARTTLGTYGHVVGNAHREAVEKVASILDPVGPKLEPVTQLIQ